MNTLESAGRARLDRGAIENVKAKEEVAAAEKSKATLTSLGQQQYDSTLQCTAGAIATASFGTQTQSTQASTQATSQATASPGAREQGAAKAKIEITVAPEYECWPFWNTTAGQYGNISPHDLKIPASLLEEILKWHAVYQSTYVGADPASSGFKDRGAEERFDEQSKDIVARLQTALSQDVDVVDETTSSSSSAR